MAKNAKKFLRSVERRLTEEGYELSRHHGKHLFYKHRVFRRFAITVPKTPKGNIVEQEHYLEQHIRRNKKFMKEAG